MAAQAWNCCCVRLRASSGLGAESSRSCALPRSRMRAFGNRNLQIMVSLLHPCLIATLVALVLPPELLSLPRSQDPSHCQQHRHPRLAEVGTGLLEQIHLGHDPVVVVPIVGEETLEVGPLLLDVRFEVDERLLIPGEDLLETPHLVLGESQLTANVPLLPELAVVPSQTARPVRSGLGGHAWRDEDAGQYQAAHEVLHAVFPTDAETLHLLYRRATWGEGRRPFSRRRGRSHRGPRPRSHRFPEGAGRRRHPARSRSRSRRRRRCSSRRPGRRAEPPELGRAARVPSRRRRPRRLPPTRPSPARAGASLPHRRSGRGSGLPAGDRKARRTPSGPTRPEWNRSHARSSPRVASSGRTVPRAGPPPGPGATREARHPWDGHGIGRRCPYSASIDLPMPCVARKRWVLTVPTLTRQSAAISARERSS